MIVINLLDIIGLCLLAAFILFWIGVILYVNISAWTARKIAKKKHKKSITAEPPEVKTYKYLCTACPKKCTLLTCELGLVPTSCPDADYIKGILDRCSLAGSIVLKYKLDVDTTRKQREFIMTVWTRRGKGGAI